MLHTPTLNKYAAKTEEGRRRQRSARWLMALRLFPVSRYYRGQDRKGYDGCYTEPLLPPVDLTDDQIAKANQLVGTRPWLLKRGVNGELRWLRTI